MVESTTAIQSAPPPPEGARVRFAQNLALEVNEANSASFLAAIGPTSTETDNNPLNMQEDSSLNEGLLSLDTPALSLFNEIGNDQVNADISGNLTTQQLQAIGILQEDLQGLEAAANINSNIPLTNGATTVDLSVEAQSIVDGVNAPASSDTLTPLSSAQLEQIGSILAPLANEPLTPAVLLQIQAQLTAAGFNPLQFNMSTIMLVMNYMAALQPVSSIEILKANQTVDVDSDTEGTVAPVTSTDRVAVEDSAILT